LSYGPARCSHTRCSQCGQPQRRF